MRDAVGFKHDEVKETVAALDRQMADVNLFVASPELFAALKTLVCDRQTRAFLRKENKGGLRAALKALTKADPDFLTTYVEAIEDGIKDDKGDPDYQKTADKEQA